MKKLMLTSLMAVFAVSSANAANYFVGGSAAFDSAKGDHNTSWNVAPEFGWHVNDKWDLGVAAGFDYNHGASLVVDEGEVLQLDKYTYDVAGFARYKVAQFGAFSVLLNGGVGVQGQTFHADEGTETLWGVGAEVSPMLTYDLSESFTLYADLKFLGARAQYNFKNKDMGREDDSWSFSAFGDTSSVMNTKDFKIGFYYNF